MYFARSTYDSKHYSPTLVTTVATPVIRLSASLRVDRSDARARQQRVSRVWIRTYTQALSAVRLSFGQIGAMNQKALLGTLRQQNCGSFDFFRSVNYSPVFALSQLAFVPSGTNDSIRKLAVTISSTLAY